MISRTAPPGSRGIDCVQKISAQQAAALRAHGLDFVVRYLGSLDLDELHGILDAGLGCMPVTFADAFDGAHAVAQCHTLGFPPGICVWLDLEGSGPWNESPDLLGAQIDGWTIPVTSAGYLPSLYVGVPQPLTSTQLYARKVVRYWRGQGRIVDHTGALAEPTCGWCMYQTYPSHMREGVWVDDDVTQHDYRGRAPVWAERN